jgi:alcohol dehydrogenase (cytochrome c)
VSSRTRGAARAHHRGLLRAFTAAAPAEDWITINKDYSSQRYVDLDQIMPANVGNLKEVCEIQLSEPTQFSSGLLKVGRTLYVTTPRATYAFDAATCQLRWRQVIDFNQTAAGSFSQRGPGYLDGRIFRGTGDGRMLALDAQTGQVLWDVQGADPTRRESFVAAPIAWQGKVFIGIAASDLGIRGRLMAFDAQTGQELWRFDTTLGTDQGGGFWTSVSLDPQTDEVFGPVSNPYPDYFGDDRPGLNLYTDSVIAVNAATGELNWFYQAVPHDEHDWDLGTPPALYRAQNGTHMLAIAGKDGHVYGLDRGSQALVFKTPATTIENADAPVEPLERPPTRVCPGAFGGAQFNGTAYHPGLGVLYVGMVEWCAYIIKDGGGGCPCSRPAPSRIHTPSLPSPAPRPAVPYPRAGLNRPGAVPPLARRALVRGVTAPALVRATWPSCQFKMATVKYY